MAPGWPEPQGGGPLQCSVTSTVFISWLHDGPLGPVSAVGVEAEALSTWVQCLHIPGLPFGGPHWYLMEKRGLVAVGRELGGGRSWSEWKLGAWESLGQNMGL